MYMPPKFAVSDDDVAVALKRAEFAHLVTHASSGLIVTPLPMLYDAERHSLIGHVARANGHGLAASAPDVAVRVAELDPGNTNANGLGKPSTDNRASRTASARTDRTAPDDGS